MNTNTELKDVYNQEPAVASAKPCPFCGSSSLGDVLWWDDDGDYLAFECLDCKASAPAIVWDNRAQ